jgi:hypothetical protein
VGGNHLNFVNGVWTCGTSSSGGAPGNAGADGTTKGIATFLPLDFVDNGSGLISLNPVLTGKNISGVTNVLTGIPSTAITFTDILTGNASVVAHGFLPKLSGVPTDVLHGNGTWSPGGSGGSASVGALGALQATDGAGAFAAYGGFACAVVGTFATAIDGNGSLTCAAPAVPPLTAKALLAQSNAEFPNAINLGGGMTGLLKSTVTAGIAAISTVVAPSGAVVGTTDTQILTNKDVVRRPLPLSTTTTPLQFDVSTFDIAVIPGMQQNTLIQNPVGTATTGQKIQIQAFSTVTRVITWGTAWDVGAVPLPATLPANTWVFWDFQYNAATGLWACQSDSAFFQALASFTFSGTTRKLATVAGVFTPGNFVTVDANGNFVDGGSVPGTGSGGTPAGTTNDIQFNTAGAFDADTGRFVYSPLDHQAGMVGLNLGITGAYVQLIDPQGFMGYQFTAPLTNDQTYIWPDESGIICTKTGGCGPAATATALAANGANCTVTGAFPNGVDASGAAENCVTLSAVNPQTGTYQVLAADFDSYKTITVASGTFTITLVASGTQPAAGKYLRIINYGAGIVTIARSGQNINGGVTSLSLSAGSATAPTSAFIISNGTDYFAAVAGMVSGGSGDITDVNITTTSPLAGGTTCASGTCAFTLSIPNAAADGTTKGAVSFVANDIDCTAGNCGIDYTNAQKVTGSVPGFLTVAAYTAFNKGYIHLPIVGAHQPTTNPGIIDRSENNERLLFDATTQECVWWNFRMPPDYVGSLVAKIPYSMFSDNNGTHGVSVDTFVMAVTPGDAGDANTDSYASVNNCGDAAIPTTLGQLDEISCTQTNADGLAAGDLVRFKLCRAPANATDNATGDMEILNEVMLEYVKQ